MRDKVEAGALYQHYKGMQYRVLGVAMHSETLEDLVIYECLYENKLSKIWARPLKMFLETIEVDGVQKQRFRKIENG